MLPFSFSQKPSSFYRLFVALTALLFFLRKDNQTGHQTAAQTEKPEENRFTKVVLSEGMDGPMAMTVLRDGRVLIVERKGALKSLVFKIPFLLRQP